MTSWVERVDGATLAIVAAVLGCVLLVVMRLRASHELAEMTASFTEQQRIRRVERSSRAQAEYATFRTNQAARGAASHRRFTLAELRQYTGEKDGFPPYVAVMDPFSGQTAGAESQRARVTVFDMSAGNGLDFYGPGAAYHVFTGKNASRGLAKMLLEAHEVEGPISLQELSGSETDALAGWYQKFLSKYTVVGELIDEQEPAAQANSAAAPAANSGSGFGSDEVQGDRDRIEESDDQTKHGQAPTGRHVGNESGSGEGGSVNELHSQADKKFN
ncbi:putative steroid-binding protein 3 [Porphyridium purpureum]|uniref:Putative steroid-binding protein 3 n=1 Tax=Porphyridium purpureum TaxID=35688 RepID=A0A5J4YK02_PORPP|nr:putative steroid-binding protein 3 [Porphyridium purpureum]|eukprot:POR1002..scf291_13